MTTVGQYISTLFKNYDDVIDVVVYLNDKLLSVNDYISLNCDVIIVFDRKVIERNVLPVINYTTDDENYSTDDNNGCSNVLTELTDYFLPDYY